ncbi:hypothetical protein [Streptomyces sp. UNOC14_S4]|uniref:hypothetical protein n=1 Tax=Streptomyces sp. UNOC14_S4 TaxID=2872340 RepID=UPI001E4E05BA|nr:hypothetical protein [Streptomyces sp. UNOC14_S4]MCC3770818.1 hypothetical protein [Streptomyces sp. UNOC14_S4]
MLAQETTRTIASPTADTAVAALGDLMVEPEAAISDPPLPAPEAGGVLLGLLAMSPKEPKEPKGK